MIELALVHVACTLYMTGLIWFVQAVHYPLMSAAAGKDYPLFQREHEMRTGYVVVPAMLGEAICAAALAVLAEPGAARILAWIGAALLVVVWASTFGLQVPAHRLLERGFDEAAHRRLVATNWVRTAAWSLRSLVALALVLALQSGG